MGNPCVSKILDCAVFTPPNPCSYDKEMKEAKANKTLPQGVAYVNTKHGSRIPIHVARHPRARCTILYSHGNSEDLGPFLDNKYLSEWYQANYICYDYTGYGYSQGEGDVGKHTEQHVYNDIEAVYEYITTELSIDPKSLILYGRSLGSGPTIHLASTKTKGMAGMVLESALLSIVRTQCRCVGETWNSDIFPNIDKCEKVECPTLVLHGTRDCVVPHYHGRYLQEHIPNTVDPLWVERGHNNVWDGEKDYYREIFSTINKFITYSLREARQNRSPNPKKTDGDTKSDVTPADTEGGTEVGVTSSKDIGLSLVDVEMMPLKSQPISSQPQPDHKDRVDL